MGAGLNGIERRKAGAEEIAGGPIRCVKFAARGGADAFFSIKGLSLYYMETQW